jgi:uncharacterized protein DUF4193
MATDYDTPRKTDDDVDSDSLEELKARRNDKSTSSVDVDEFEAAEGLELPGADLSNEELAVRVLPKQQDEFTCMTCFLVHHRSQLAREKNGQPICRDCDWGRVGRDWLDPSLEAPLAFTGSGRRAVRRPW